MEFKNDIFFHKVSNLSSQHQLNLPLNLLYGYPALPAEMMRDDWC
jgi:hypothetical protein